MPHLLDGILQFLNLPFLSSAHLSSFPARSSYLCETETKTKLPAVVADLVKL